MIGLILIKQRKHSLCGQISDVRVYQQKLKNELCGNVQSSELVMTEYTGSVKVVVHDWTFTLLV